MCQHGCGREMDVTADEAAHGVSAYLCHTSLSFIVLIRKDKKVTEG